MMPYGKQDNEKRTPAKKRNGVRNTSVLRHVLPANHQDKNRYEDSSHAKKIMQELCKIDADKAHVETENPTN